MHRECPEESARINATFAAVLHHVLDYVFAGLGVA